MRRATPDEEPPTEDAGATPEGGDPIVVRLDEGSDGWGDLLGQLVRHRPPESPLREIDEVARGGMGRVLCVIDRDLRRQLAMKTMEPSPTGSDEGSLARRIGRFLEEAQVTAQLDHPCIVPVHQLGVADDGRLFFTMKLVRGRTLKDILPLARTGAEGWSQPRIVSVLLRTVEALAFAHRKGVIHRDLKPSNIMVGRYGETYVMDWGLARVRDHRERKDVRPATSTHTAESFVRSDRRELEASDSDTPLATMDGDVIGTPAYMAPEQAAGRLDDIGPHTDVYAVGAILYHVLSGQPPYVPPNSRVSQYLVLRFILEGAPPSVGRLARTAPAELIAICERAMQRVPSERYPSMDELAEDLRAYLEGRVVQAYAVGAVAELRKWVGRNRLFAATAAASLAVICVLSTFFMISLRRETNAAQESAALARAKSEEAEGNRRAAERAWRHAQATVDLSILADLRVELGTLWPVSLQEVDAARGWLTRLSDVEARRERYQIDDGEAVDVDEEERTLYQQVLESLDSFQGRGANAPQLGRRTARVATLVNLAERSIDDHRDDWQAAINAIADSARSPAYGGLVIRPQVGLVPIGCDPDSGLQEFWHVLTGERPTRDEHDRIEINERMGVVLILIPAASFVMGAQADEPDEPRYDPLAADDEFPPHPVRLDPYFISKYEITQAQWLSITDDNPSINPGPLLPVERVSWIDCRDGLARVGLILPTEAQWEYAARGGTSTPWFAGASADVLDRFANLADFSALNVVGDANAVDGNLNDGAARDAPIGSFAPNQYGLHDTAGNVFEWCRDAYLGYYGDPTDGTGERVDPSASPRTQVIRGGSYMHLPSGARSCSRSSAARRITMAFLGVRPARALDR